MYHLQIRCRNRIKILLQCFLILHLMTLVEFNWRTIPEGKWFWKSVCISNKFYANFAWVIDMHMTAKLVLKHHSYCKIWYQRTVQLWVIFRWKSRNRSAIGAHRATYCFLYTNPTMFPTDFCWRFQNSFHHVQFIGLSVYVRVPSF